ncbi:hypothetical protein DXX93_13685 [Thalassotalea euphylliae]|jgi:hypothetical protein|uniref:Uncharacterized protein n=1 Tax=Thalassotalea euphylliae TaxID=1655234 RepID=A0A3E0TS94_9GAMM|nr:hypothetical protein [Thalassotalea euphylliae]REL27506.1 hypothetical protein DXX93_13685 [Thalassotalea euphylliae]
MQLVVDNNEKNEKHVILVDGKVKWVLPDDMHGQNFLLLYIDYTKRKSFRELSHATKLNIGRGLVTFLDYTVVLIRKYSGVPSDIFSRYTNHIKTTTNKTSNSVNSTVTAMLYVLKLYGGQKEKVYDCEYWIPEFYVMITKAPTFTWEEPNPKESLSTKYDLGFTSNEMIESLLLLCCYIINTFNDKRKLLLQNRNLEKVALESFQISSDSYPTYALISDQNHPTYNVARRLYGELARTIIATEDNWLIERFMHDNPFPDEFLPDESDIKIRRKEWLKRWINKRTGDIKTLITINKKKYRMQTMKAYCMNDLHGLSHEVVFAMQCILACHRIQSSGVDRMNLNDVISNNKGVQFKYYKGRGKIKYATSVLNKGTLPYNTVQIFLEQFKQQHPGVNPKLIQYHKLRGKTDVLGQIGTKKGRLDHFFIDLLDENTEVHKHMKAELKEEAAPILAFLKKILVNNLIALENSPAYGGDNKMPHVSLNIDLIARARIEIEDGKSGAAELKENSEYDKTAFEEKADKEVGAMLTAHNLETKQSTYENRSRSPEKIKSMRRFAAQVGDAMEQDARAVEELFNKTKVLNLKAVAKLLGIEDTIEEQKDLYDIINQQLGDVIGDIGDVDIDGKRIVIQTPLTAALIVSKIKHIENEIPRLKVVSEKKALKAQLHRAYLDTLLAEFSSSIIKEGELMSKKYNFPFSSMV